MANERPFYVIAHRCNNSGDIEKALTKGANAFECDVHYGEKDDNWCVNHDGYRPNHSITIEDWLTEAYENQKNNMCFLYLDIKSQSFLGNLIDHVHKCTKKYIDERKRPIYIIYSIDKLDKAKSLFKENVNKLMSWEGFTVDYNNDPDEVNRCFAEIRISGNNEFNRFFYGNGVTALVPDSEKMHKNLRRACELRDSDDIIKKTYIWTIEKESTALKYLEIGVDAIMTNAGGGDVPRDKIQNIFDAINEYNKKTSDTHVRLATICDDPFTVFKP